MPALNAHTVTVWCPFFYSPTLDGEGHLVMPTDYSPAAEGGRLIDEVRRLWEGADRPNCAQGFQPSPVQGKHLNGYCSFTVAFIEHEGDGPLVESLKKASLRWRYDDDSTPIRITHIDGGDLSGEWVDSPATDTHGRRH